MKPFIVAEITKNWPNNSTDLISQLFEEVIEGNLSRGYTLHSFSIAQVFTGDGMSETIIAVFKLKEANGS